MYRKVLAVVLIVCLQALSFAGQLAALSFKVNKDYIAAKICENRAKPKLNCKGKCYLNKIEKKAKEQKEANDTTLKVAYYLHCVPLHIQDFRITALKTSYIHQNHNDRHKGWLKSHFHPPGILS